MRLINAQTMVLDEFFDDDLPKYVILSHTWGKDEILYHDMGKTPPSTKSGYTKITTTCRLALEMDIPYVWVDTCCIDKTSSAELTESINSMFDWYARSTVCVVWLSDFEPDTEFKDGIDKCLWVFRGWTLQELIAPSTIIFYDKSWTYRGTKSELSQELSEATLAARRKTTRVEDEAYCLLGIMEVNMPLIYGEKAMAFRRLQEEIIKRSNDITVFAWNPICTEPTHGRHSHCSLLAPSPANFLHSGSIVAFNLRRYNPEFLLTNKGIRREECNSQFQDA
ncbi:heterokaryon incompatibility protein-domain-containing protein [Podospora australis]|uniref:Heterokaryon incompatibility protein-domain-containing protein n=1 Tax=Podospora australis TaxID=1536484 RepID=A0AAN6WPA8_9PEZI|nr:heterokaryon incompatibility protein-domain-containing protein [Podospora australis]